MSLISTASPWISEDPQKKRAATLRKTIKKPLAQNPIQPLNEDSSIGIREFDPPSHAILSRYEMDNHSDDSKQGFETARDSVDRNQRVNEVLQKMDVESDGKNLADFRPLSHPAVQPQNRRSANHQTDEVPSSMRPLASANNYSLDKNSDYRVVYQPTTSNQARYESSRNSRPDDKLLDKINYMIHLLEEQANEKTNNQMEEFVMFSLVGVFLIYVLDSFSRSGRYIR